ncbi:glycoside hydrolase family 3 protein [Gluconacetobacter sacchari]|nr:glycoside hydrolase family 3 C-terminal domain-containing protein [Gluconacetobacter sacchari]
MTLAEKLGLLDGGGRSDARCVGYTLGVPRLGIPALCMGDGPAGVGNGLKSVTVFPAPIAIGASWDTALAVRYGAVQAEEQSGKGRNVALLPTINILRNPLWGRAAETLGEDPVLTSALGVAIVKGVQSRHVIAMPKHFAANNQETDRFGDAPDWKAMNAVVSERALREIYLPAFKAVVQDAQAGSIMCAYNRVNGQYACENRNLLRILRDEWHFGGFVTSDWLFAGRSTVASIKAGADQLMPGGKNPYGLPDYYGAPLVQALKQGAVDVADVNRMVGHVLNAMRRIGVEDASVDRSAADVRSQRHSDAARDFALAGIVLLRNAHETLPIGDDIRRLAIIGPDADDQRKITEPYGGFVPEDPAHVAVTPLQAIRRLAGRNREVVFQKGTEGVRPLPPLPLRLVWDEAHEVQGWRMSVQDQAGQAAPPTWAHVKDIGDLSVLRHGRILRWDGFVTPDEGGVYRFSLAGGGAAKLLVDDKEVVSFQKEEFNAVSHGEVVLAKGRRTHLTVIYDPTSAILPLKLALGWAPPSSIRAAAVAAARKADMAIVFVNDEVSEGADRSGLGLPGDQDALITAVAEANPRTVVVMDTVAAVLTPWRNKVAGILEAWYGGERNGDAIADILFGRANPSGHLPLTFPADASQGVVSTFRQQMPDRRMDVKYDEGIMVGYRYYDEHRQLAAYPFGFGLTYTSFAISHVKLETDSVSFDLKNIGKRPGDAVIQLYVGFPEGAGEPPRQLKTFIKSSLRPGQSRHMLMPLSGSMFQKWDDGTHAWRKIRGDYKIYLGFSSRDMAFEGDLTI